MSDSKIDSGVRTDISARLVDYVPYFEGQSNVLDVGCGRGEFLALLKERGITSEGLDLNPEMIEVCRLRGLGAATADARSYLQGLAGRIAWRTDRRAGGRASAAALSDRHARLAFDKIRPGGRIVLETINPSCWVAFFESFIRDLTHVKPIHPETLQYFLQANGFSNVEIVYRAPIAAEGRLRKVTARPEHFGDTAPDALDGARVVLQSQRRSAERADVLVSGFCGDWPQTLRIHRLAMTLTIHRLAMDLNDPPIGHGP